MNEGPPIRITKEELAPIKVDLSESDILELLPENQREEYLLAVSVIRGSQQVVGLKPDEGYWQDIKPLEQDINGCVLACARMAMTFRGLPDPGPSGIREQLATSIQDGSVHTTAVGMHGKGAVIDRIKSNMPIAPSLVSSFLQTRGIKTELIADGKEPAKLIDALVAGSPVMANVSLEELGAWGIKNPSDHRGGHEILFTGLKLNPDGTVSFRVNDPLENESYDLKDTTVAQFFLGDGGITMHRVENQDGIVLRGPLPTVAETSNVEEMIYLLEDDLQIELARTDDEKRLTQIQETLADIEAKIKLLPESDITTIKMILKDIINRVLRIFKD